MDKADLIELITTSDSAAARKAAAEALYILGKRDGLTLGSEISLRAFDKLGEKIS